MKNNPQKIVFTGPESSGKSTSANLIAKHYNSFCLPEYARTYLEQINYPYKAADLLKIAEGQLTAEKEFINNHIDQPCLFFDTSFLVLKVWSIFKYGFYHIRLEELLHQNLPDFYFLCDWNTPWEYDPMREAPNLEDRAQLYQIYKEEIQHLKVPFYELKGSIEERLIVIEKVLQEVQLP